MSPNFSGGGGTERNVGERGAQTCTRHRGMPGTEQAQGCLSIILKGKELRNGRGQGRSVILVIDAGYQTRDLTQTRQGLHQRATLLPHNLQFKTLFFKLGTSLSSE